MELDINSGIFVTLYDVNTLALYLQNGIYGFLMNPVLGDINPRSIHYRALADYACVREGTHIFFFLKRKIVYGGRAIGDKDIGSFYINGIYSPLGMSIGAPLCWDESIRNCYGPKETSGIFEVPNVGDKCQPYLILFEPNEGLTGKYISSDDLYFSIGKYPYPLPSNSIQGMSFCSLSPGETEEALNLLKNSKKSIEMNNTEGISLKGKPILFKKDFGIQDLKEAFIKNIFINEAHFEFSILANPYLLPEEVRPKEGDVICRQVPISPFKPFQMDRADICYYSQDKICNGTIPNVIIELKNKSASKAALKQVERYLDWLYLVLNKNDADKIRVYIIAPSSNINLSESKYQNKIKIICPT